VFKETDRDALRAALYAAYLKARAPITEALSAPAEGAGRGRTDRRRTLGIAGLLRFVNAYSLPATDEDAERAGEHRREAAGLRFKFSRWAAGRRQAEVAAQLIGIRTRRPLSRAAVHAYEAGESTMARENIVAAARIFRVDPQWLLHGLPFLPMRDGIRVRCSLPPFLIGAAADVFLRDPGDEHPRRRGKRWTWRADNTLPGVMRTIVGDPLVAAANRATLALPALRYGKRAESGGIRKASE
jgi:hypothetical protein